MVMPAVMVVRIIWIWIWRWIRIRIWVRNRIIVRGSRGNYRDLPPIHPSSLLSFLASPSFAGDRNAGSLHALKRRCGM